MHPNRAAAAVAFILVVLPLVSSSPHFISQYFSTIRPVKKVALIHICKDNDSIALVRELNKMNLIWSMAADTVDTMLGPSGCFIDCLNCECKWANANFNGSYSWLIMGHHRKVLEDISTSIRLDSQVTLLEAVKGGYRAFDVFRNGSPTLRLKEFGNYTGQQWSVDKLLALYHKEYRGNLNKMEVRTAIPIGYPVSSRNTEAFDEAFSSSGSSFKTLCMIKFNHAMNILLRERFNFTMKVNRVPRDINGKVRELRGGALGILSRNESDIVSAGALVRGCRLREFDYIFCRLFLRVDLYYRITPDLVNQDKETFLAPLDKATWAALVVILFFIAISLISQGKKILASLWDLIHLTAIQSYTSIDKYRITILTSLYLIVILFNIYATSLLKIILTPPKDPFRSLKDVFDFLSITRFDIFFIGVSVNLAANETNHTYFESFYTGQDPVKYPKSQLTIFKDGFQGLEYLRRGHVAFASEGPTANFAIKFNYSAEEICEMRSRNIMNDQLYYVLRKRSEFSQMFKIGLMKADESGLVKRALDFYVSEFPKCSAPVTVYSVPLWKIQGAFFILIYGAFAAVILLVLEQIHHRGFCRYCRPKLNYRS